MWSWPKLTRRYWQILTCFIREWFLTCHGQAILSERKPDSAGEFTVNDTNMVIAPEAQWELEGMYDSFAYVDEYFTTLLNKAMGKEEGNTV